VKLSVNEAPEYLLAAARRRGIGEAEVFVETSRRTRVEVSRGRVEELGHADEVGVAMRILRDGATGFSFTASLEGPALEDLVERSEAAARVATADEYAGLGEAMPAPEAQGIWDPELAKLKVGAKLRTARDEEKACLSADSRINSVIFARYEDAATTTRIVNSRGLDRAYPATLARLIVFCTAAGKDKGSMGEGVVEERAFAPLRKRQVGREAARRAAIAVAGIPPETDEMTLLFKPWAALSFLHAVIGALGGEAVQLGQSMFVGKQGQVVASPLVNLIDDGLLPGRPGSSPVDGEGVPRQTTPLVTDGVLRGHYHDLRSARRAGVPSTGNAGRIGYRHPPRQSPSNACLAAGETPPGTLLSSIDYGIEVVSFTDTGGVNGITGDFSVAASGRRIRHGQLSESLDPFTICGNLRDLLMQITGVGTDLTWFGNLGSPTVRIDGLKVVGGN